MTVLMVTVAVAACVTVAGLLRVSMLPSPRDGGIRLLRMSAGGVMILATAGADLARFALPDAVPIVLGLQAVSVIACSVLVWAGPSTRLALTLDGAIVACGLALLIRGAIVVTGPPVATGATAQADLVVLVLVLWQSFVLAQLVIREPRRAGAPRNATVVGLMVHVLAWVAYGLGSARGLAWGDDIAIALITACHVGAALAVALWVGQVPAQSTAGYPGASRLPYVVTITALVMVGPALTVDERLQDGVVLGLGLLGVVALQLRAMLAQAALRQASREVVRGREYFARLLADSNDVIMIADRRGVISYVSSSAGRILGPGMAGVGGQVPATLGVPERAFEDMLGRLSSGEPGPQLLEGRRGHLMLEASISLRGDDVMVNVRDVTERDRLRQRLHFLAYHDPLTGLANRSRVLSRISAMLSRSELCTVLFVDLDRFKQVNDNSGHSVGDQVLQQVAARLGELLRAGDLIGRLGGDEFVAVLALDRTHAERVATRIQETLSRPFEVDGREYQLGVSVGIAEGLPGLQAEELLRRADLAMYAAKRRHGSFVVYEAGLGRAALAQANTDMSVGRALRDRDLDLFVQPLVELSTGRVTAVEALLRWRDESGTIRPPTQMLDFARRSGRMPEVTEWVLQRAIDIIAAAPPGVSIAINIPPEMVLLPTMSQQITELLALHRVPAERIEIEVTEDQLLEQADSCIGTLQALRDAGMAVMIDDFGTGFSSLGYLLDLPIDGLKIDQRFTKALPYSESARSIVSGLVGITGRMGLRVVAEGIENADQHAWASRLGVHVGQGYWYARPESSAVVRDLADLSAWSTSQMAGLLRPRPTVPAIRS